MIYLSLFIYLQAGFGFAMAVNEDCIDIEGENMPWYYWLILIITWPFFFAAIFAERLDD